MPTARPRSVALLVLVLTLHSALLAPAPVVAAQQLTVLESYWVRSATGGPVYPGSQSATLTLHVRYYGNTTLASMTACVEDSPSELMFRNKCDVAYDLDPGDVAEFTFVFDVDRGASPGNYPVTIRVSTGSTTTYHTVIVAVEEYPEPLLKAVDAWLEPHGYNATAGTRVVIVIENEGEVDVVEGYGTLLLPDEFTPRRIHVEVGSIGAGDRGRIVAEGVRAPTEPGLYEAQLVLNLKLRTSDGVEYWRQTRLEHIVIAVGSTPRPVLRVLDAYWARGGYANSANSLLRLVIENTGHCSIERLLVTLDTAAPIRPHAPVLVAEPIPASGIAAVDIATDIGVVEGPISVGVRAYAQLNCDGQRLVVYSEDSVSIDVLAPDGLVEVVDTGLRRGYGLQEASAATVYVALRNLNSDTLVHVTATLQLENTVALDGRNQVTVSLDTTLAYGATLTLQFSNIAARNGVIRAVLSLVLVYSDDGSRYSVRVARNLTVHWSPVQPLQLAETRVEYNGEPAPLLPGQKGAEIIVTLLNTLPDTITSIILAGYDTPTGVKVTRIDGTCTAGVAPGSTCTIRLWVETSSIQPGDYNISLELEPVIGAEAWRTRQVIVVPISIADPDDYAPQVTLLSAYWGTPGSPSKAYTGVPRQPLTVQLYNKGRGSIQSLVATVSGDWVKPLNTHASCGAMPPGSVCQLVFYLDLASVEPGNKTLSISIEYLYREYGVNMVFEKTYSLSLPVERVGEGIRIIRATWAAKAYPGSKGAVLTLVLANLNPYPLAAVEIRLDPPKGVSPAFDGGLRYYIEGPLQAFGEATAEFHLNISTGLAPGYYMFKALVRYWVVDAGVYTEKTATLPFWVEVSSPREAIEPVTVVWQGPSPGPGERAARLLLVFRVLDPNIHAPVLTLKLPKGLVYAETGEPTARVAPYAFGARMPAELEAVLRSIGASLQEQQSFIAYTVPVVVSPDAGTGNYTVRAIVSFIDAWGSRHNVSYELVVPLQGQPRPLIVASAERSVLANGTAVVEVTLWNRGSGPAYNIYAFLIPETPVAYPVNPLAYVERIDPGEKRVLHYRLVYNPYGYMGYSGYTFAARLVVAYQDPKGYNYMLNTTISTILYPAMRVEAHSIRAEYSNGTLQVSLILVNTGSETAERVTIRLVVGGETVTSSLVGDIEPATEVPVRLEARLPRKPDNATIVVEYYDHYDNPYTAHYTVKVRETIAVQPGEHETQQPDKTLAIAIATLVAGIASAAILWRLRARRRHGAPGEAGPAP